MLELWVRRRSKALFAACAFTSVILLCLKYVYLGDLEMPGSFAPSTKARLLEAPPAVAAIHGAAAAADESMVAYDLMQPETPAEDRIRFDMTRRSDVMVFLHIQKTGGTVFERHLIKDLDIEHPCVPGPGRKRYVRIGWDGRILSQ